MEVGLNVFIQETSKKFLDVVYRLLYSSSDARLDFKKQ